MQKLSNTEKRYLLNLLYKDKIDGGYYGVKKHYIARQERLIERFESELAAVVDYKPRKAAKDIKSGSFEKTPIYS